MHVCDDTCQDFGLTSPWRTLDQSHSLQARILDGFLLTFIVVWHPHAVIVHGNLTLMESWSLAHSLPNTLLYGPLGCSKRSRRELHVLLDGRDLTLDVFKVIAHSKVKRVTVVTTALRHFLQNFAVKWIDCVYLQNDSLIGIVSCHSDSLDDAATDVVFTSFLVLDCHTQDHLCSYVLLDRFRHRESQSRVYFKAFLKHERHVFGRDALGFESLAFSLNSYQLCQFVDIVGLGGEVDRHDELLLLLVATSTLLGYRNW